MTTINKNSNQNENKSEIKMKVVEQYVNNEKDLTRKAATMQISMSLLASLSVTTCGIGIGYPAITTQILLRGDGDIVLTPSEISWFASVTSILMPVGSLLAGLLTEKMGRRNTLMFINVVAIASWLIIGFSSETDVQIFFIMLMIGRALIGITIGMITSPSVMYASEISHAKLRGRLTLLSAPLFMSFGTLVAYLLGFLIPYDFRLVAFISAGITAATFIILFFIPESPVFLITKNKIDKARNGLAMFRNLDKNDPKIDAEIAKISESKRVTDEKHSFIAHCKEFKKAQLYIPFLIMLAFFGIQQFSGIFVLLVYAAQFSIEAGVIMDPFLSSVIIGSIRFFTTLLIAYASDKLGRKPVAISSAVGMSFCMLGIILGAVFSVTETNFSWLPTFFLFGFVLTGTAGILPLPFAMVAEMFPQKSRGFASSVTMCIAFLFSFVHIKLFPILFEYLGNIAVFSFYAAVSVAGVLFSIFILPETKGKTLHEIEEYFRRK